MFKFGIIQHPNAKFDSIACADEKFFNDYGVVLEPNKINKLYLNISQFSEILNLSFDFLYEYFEQFHPDKKHAGKPEWCFERKHNKEVLEFLNCALVMAQLIKKS